MKYLVVVNMQNDYITGALKNEAAQAIIPGVCKKIEEYKSNGYLIFVVYDKRGPDYLETYEGKHFPIQHCIQGTEGYMLNDSVLDALNHMKYGTLVEKQSFGAVLLPPMMWEAARVTGLPDEIEIVGTRTDADILSTAIIVKNEFRERPVVVDASLCAGTTPDKHYLALNAMKCAQIEVVNEGKEPW